MTVEVIFGDARISIREATSEDAGGMGLLHRTGLHALAESGIPAHLTEVPAAERASEWRHWLRAQSLGRAQGLVLIADSAQGPLGFACVTPEIGTAGQLWRLTHIFVAPSCQGRGLGGHLIKAAFVRARSLNADFVVAAVAPASWALGFMRHHGGRETGDVTPVLRCQPVTLQGFRFDLTGVASL